MSDQYLMRRGNSGFTLFELLTVLALIAVLGALVVPSVRLADSAPLDTAVAKINTALDEARTRSLLQRSHHDLEFSPSGVRVLPDKVRTIFPDGVLLVSMTIEGEEDRRPDAFPALLPFHPRGNTVSARLILEASGREHRKVLGITPFGYAVTVLDD